jgi:hypothetical protein
LYQPMRRPSTRGPRAPHALRASGTAPAGAGCIHRIPLRRRSHACADRRKASPAKCYNRSGHRWKGLSEPLALNHRFSTGCADGPAGWVACAVPEPCALLRTKPAGP